MRRSKDEKVKRESSSETIPEETPLAESENTHQRKGMDVYDPRSYPFIEVTDPAVIERLKKILVNRWDEMREKLQDPALTNRMRERCVRDVLDDFVERGRPHRIVRAFKYDDEKRAKDKEISDLVTDFEESFYKVYPHARPQ